MSGGLSDSGVPPSTDEQNEAQPSEPCRRLTFVSHAGEDKDFARSLLDAIEAANVATFFDDDMAVGTPAGDEMTTCAAAADQGIVVLSRPFLTKGWPMMELNLFVKNRIRIHPLYYDVNPDELQGILETYDRQAGDDEPAFRLNMKENPWEWQKLMEEVAGATRVEGSSRLPDPMCWREDLRELSKLTGLRREDFREDEDDKREYVTAVAKMVSSPVLPAIVPPLPDHFVNLHIVEDVISKLLDCALNTEKRGVVLTGIGGAGKSVIASAVVRDKRIRRQFADGVLWLDQEPGEYNELFFLLKLNKLSQQFEEVVLSRHYRQGRDTQYTLNDFQSVSGAQDFFKMWQNKFNLQCLLVVDNTWNVQVFQAVRAMGFQILATTRKETAIPASPGWRSEAVPRMGEDSSLRVLQNCSGATAAVPREALEVARKCAFLPLALAIAGSTLRGGRNPLSSDTWLKLHRKLRSKENEGGERGALNNMLAVSVDDLGQWRRDLFFMLAVLGNGIPAPTEMLCHLWGEKDMEGARFLADGLVSRSLLQRRVRDQYAVHDLLLDFAKMSINKSSSNVKDDATSRQATYLGRIKVLRSYFGDEKADAGLYALTTLWLSLKELGGDSVSAVKEYTASLEDLDRSGKASESRVADTRCAVARVFQLQGNLAEAESLYDRAIHVAGNSRGEEDRQMGIWLNNLAALKFEQGKYREAVELFDRAHAIREKVLGPEHPDVAQSFMNRALVMKTLNEYDIALELMDRARSIFKEAYGETHQWIADTLNARASVFIDLGNFEDAESLLVDAVAIGDETLGPEHPRVATFLNSLGSVLLLQEKFKEAEKHYERCRAITENTLGPRSLGVVPVINNLAELKKYQGEYDVSLKLFKDVVTIAEEVLGAEHSTIGSALNNQAVVLVALGKHHEAEKLCAEAAWIFVKAYGSESHQLVSNPINNWAEALTRQGKYDMAILLFERAVKIRIEKLERGHQETQHTTRLLQQAKMDHMMQAPQIQNTTQRSMFPIPRQPTVDSLGGSGRLDAKSLVEAGSQCFADGDLEQAYEWYSSALEDGKYDPLAWTTRFRASVLINRATVLCTQREFGRCAADCSAALEIDPDRAAAYYRRFIAKQQLGQTDDALGDALKALMACFSQIAMAKSMAQDTPAPVLTATAATAPLAQHPTPSSPHVSTETSANAPPDTASTALPAGADGGGTVESIDRSIMESRLGQAQAERDMQLAIPLIGPEVRPDEGHTSMVEEPSGEMAEEEELRQAIELSLSPGVP